jgi:two-component system response regulator VicR
MLVDDNLDLVYMVKKGIERITEDYEIIGVNSGKECLEHLERDEAPDLILLDIMMPEMDGWNLFAKIKEKPNWDNVPIVFLTAKTDDYSVGFGKTTATDYIEKPFEIEDLKLRIDKILNR